MKLKLDAAGNAVLQDGKPVYIDDKGKEFAFDAGQMYSKITELQGESKDHRVRAETAETKLKAFEGIDNASDALKALETVRNLDQKKLVDAGQVETIKAEAIKAVRAEFEPVVAERDKLKGDLHSERIGGSFSRSKYIADKASIPADMMQARFGANFKVEEGKVVVYDGAGNKIYSRARPGELADFDEGLETLVDQYPYKAHILKGSGASGSGSQNNQGGGGGGKRVVPRAEFQKLSPAEQSKAATDPNVQITD